MSDTYEKIYNCVNKIPFGKVSTYKKVAEQAGLAGQARLVGYALHNLKEGNNIPWHRVINSTGHISLKSGYDNLQISLLQKEKIVISEKGKIDLNKYCWY